MTRLTLGPMYRNYRIDMLCCGLKLFWRKISDRKRDTPDRKLLLEETTLK